MNDGVRPERTGWRDERISRRHREWGYNCPAVDLDFLVAEYNTGEPVALVEYKHEAAQRANLQHPTYRALRKLCGFGQLPFMVVYYRPEPWRFLILPANPRADGFYEGPRSLSERDYVTSLYVLRKRVIQEHVLAKLDTDKDPLASWRAMSGEAVAA